jgi:hypothetical protein
MYDIGFRQCHTLRKRTTMIMAIDNEGKYKYIREGTHLLMDNASIHKTKHIQNIKRDIHWYYSKNDIRLPMLKHYRRLN